MNKLLLCMRLLQVKQIYQRRHPASYHEFITRS